jgi:competence protein ComFC
MIGYNEFGHPEFDTVRSELGEMVYRLKYSGDKGVIAPVVEAVAGFVNSWGIHPDAIVPMPPSKQRSFQPVVEIARELARSMNIPLNIESLQKTKTTQQMKDVGDFPARVAALEAAFASDKGLEGKEVLLFDDLFQSGATMNVAARSLKARGFVKSVYALALTRTRN